MTIPPQEKHYYYLEPDKKLCHFYPHCEKIKGSLVEIDSEKYAREYICKSNNNYQICKQCSRENQTNLVKLVGALRVMVLSAHFLSRDWFNDVRVSKLWLTSPQGNHYQLPHYQALRIAKKHDWGITETIPRLSRWQAVKYILRKKKQNEKANNA